MMISILVPVYGVERYIERCATSLFEQTYTDLEYIFVDDCSPDDSMALLRAVIDRYPDRKPRVRLLRNDRNRGLGYTRSAGVAAARGEYVMFVDSDDYLPTTAAERLAANAQLTEAEIVDGRYCFSCQNSLSQPVKEPVSDDKTRLMKNMLCQDVVPSHVWARLIKLSLFTSNGINFTEGVDFAEDFSVMPRLMYPARRSAVDDVVYYYNTDNLSSYTHSTTERHVVSLIRSNAIVYDYFMNVVNDKTLRPAAQVGRLNLLRNVRRNGFPMTLVDRYFPARAEGAVFRTAERIMRGGCPFSVANALFLVMRRIVSAL